MLYSKRLICISTVIIMLVFILAIPVSAKVTNNSNISTSSLYETVCLDEYSTMAMLTHILHAHIIIIILITITTIRFRMVGGCTSMSNTMMTAIPLRLQSMNQK